MKISKFSKLREFKETKNSLCLLRKQFLAHNDGNKSHTEIEIQELIELLDELRRILNSLCFSEVSNKASEIKESDLNMLKASVSLGFGCMLNSNLLKE